MIYLLLALGFLLLVAGGEALVRGAVSIAERLGVSPLLIGLTLVGFGTSTPELVTSLQAAYAGLPGIAVGNIVGSNTANILLILGVAVVIAPIPVARASFARDGVALGAAAVLCTAVVLYGTLDRWLGLLLLAALAVYLVVAYLTDRTSEQSTEATSKSPIWLGLLLAVGGITLTIIGARVAVNAAVEIATLWGMSETVVGLTIVAVGTSLPELVTSVMAALRREQAIAFGNVVGSNIYNVLGILGVTAAVRPIAVPAEIAQVDIWVMCAATVAVIASVVWRERIGRLFGVAALGSYALYIGWLI